MTGLETIGGPFIMRLNLLHDEELTLRDPR